jgi:hypothetical protein
MGSSDVRLLPYKDLANRAVDVLIFKGFLVSLLGRILALFRGFQKRVIAATQMSLYIAPDAVNATGGSATDVFSDPCGMLQFVLKFCTR